ncbi:uncharacterized protein LOC136084665 [Hydra vulgaris]|uniref:Uncharacterized protein LOC136084665 n=1 Tax=Hydra vulgaris TaxID=6087 RepID=A0ABM4CHI2_HYDVU
MANNDKKWSGMSKEKKRLVINEEVDTFYKKAQEDAAIHEVVVSYDQEEPKSSSLEASSNNSINLGSYRSFESIIDTSSEEIKNKSLLEEIRVWAIQYNVENKALDDLLKILITKHPELPKSCKTLLKCSSTHLNISKMGSGEFVHFGLETELIRYIESGLQSFRISSDRYNLLCAEATHFHSTLITLTFNIDGMPLFKSCSKSFWPILAKVNESTCLEPFIVSLYFGTNKPNDLNKYFSGIVENLNNLKYPIVVSGQRYLIRAFCIVSDAPARAFIKGIKYFNGYNGCEYCRQTGSYINGKVVFDNHDAPARTDQQFLNFQEKDHQKEMTAIGSIVPPVTCVPAEYMHLLCEGVFRKLLFLWVSSTCKYKGSFRIPPSNRVALSNKIVENGKHMPKEFKHRKVRPLVEMDRWKATEFRTFFIYLAPLVMRSFLHPSVYAHTMLLHFAAFNMLGSDFLPIMDNISWCLKKFVTTFADHYGKGNLVYNIHCLLHLDEFVKNLGPLDFWSSFPFENKLRHIKKTINSNTNCLKQCINNVIRNSIFRTLSPSCNNLFYLSTHSPDNIYLTSSGMCYFVCYRCCV